MEVLKMHNLTDRLLEHTGWPIIFDQNTFVPSRENEQFVQKMLYNKDIFGLVIDEDNKIGIACKRCNEPATRCIGHYALARLAETHRYILPTYITECYKLAMKYNVHLKNRTRKTNKYGTIHHEIVNAIKPLLTPSDFFARTSIYIVIMPLTSRFQYMNETRFHSKKKCQYTTLFNILLRPSKFDVVAFHQELENMNVQKNRIGGTWDLSQAKSFKRLNLKPSLHDTLSRKEGFLRKSCIGGRVNKTNRQVAIPDSRLELDEVGTSPEVYRAINPKNSIVISCRHPALYCTNLMKVQVVPILTSNARVHAYPPEICPAYHLDFDGDETGFYVRDNDLTSEPSYDHLLHTPQHLLRHDYGFTLFAGSYNAICGVYMLSRWMETAIHTSIVAQLNRILRIRKQSEFPVDRHHQQPIRRRDLLEKIIAITSGLSNLSINGYVESGRLISNKIWRKEQWMEFENVAKRIRRGDETNFLFDFRTIALLINRFLYFHAAELTISCSSFARARKLANLAILNSGGYAKLEENFEKLVSRALEWFPPTSGEHIIVDSHCKGTLMHLAQAVCAIGPITVNYFINDFIKLCALFRIPARRLSPTMAMAFVVGNYYDGLNDLERYVVSITGREGPVISIVNTPDGGYGRRKTAFLTSGYIINYQGCVQEGKESNTSRWLPPPTNVQSLDRYLDIKLASAVGLPVDVASTERRVATRFDRIAVTPSLVRDENGRFLIFEVPPQSPATTIASDTTFHHRRNTSLSAVETRTTTTASSEPLTSSSS